jgi:hypothetical protein
VSGTVRALPRLEDTALTIAMSGSSVAALREDQLESAVRVRSVPCRDADEREAHGPAARTVRQSNRCSAQAGTQNAVAADGLRHAGLTAGSWIVDGNIRLSNGDPAMPYCQLTLQEREVISQMRFSGLGPTAIGRRLWRSASTISRELRRNGSGDGYQAVSAQRVAAANVGCLARWTVPRSTRQCVRTCRSSGLRSRLQVAQG